MKTNILILLIVLLTIHISCNSNQENIVTYSQGSNAEISMEKSDAVQLNEDVKSTPTTDEAIESSPSNKDEKTGQQVTVHKKKIIKDGYISVKTKDIQTSKKAINFLLKKYNAYYESEDLQNDDYSIAYQLKIRIPSDNFENLISNIEQGKDEIKSKSIQARDVTEAYLDIETRLTNKKEYLKRYKELLAKASTVKDIIDIEESIRVLQEEIESKEGQLKYLSDQVSFSTLNIHIFQEKAFVYKPEPQDKFTERVKTSIHNGWISIVNLLLWIMASWPYFILVFILFFLVRRIRNKRKI
ncbi:MAG: DUF4349 domain-containing protein [Chitinophagales bacterium]|nr:DUF4349 domain-containing protein [Chitinophagales bacterium]MCZ2393457.1 DUF4349 domain-containing protein [Chitinophagales bacterium]